MKIRPAGSDDANAACAVLRRSITELCTIDHRDDEALLAGWLANKTSNQMASWIAGGNVFVAEEKGEVVGVAAIARTGDITLNYVAPEARFMGVSKALMKVVEARALALGCRSCTVHSTRTALRFYLALGYRPHGDPSERILAKALQVDART